MFKKYIGYKIFNLVSAICLLTSPVFSSSGQAVDKDNISITNMQDVNTTENISYPMCSIEDFIKSIKVRNFSKSRIEKNINEDFDSLKSLEDTLKKDGLEIRRDLENTSGFRINLTKKDVTSEVKKQLISKFGPDMSHGYMIRGLYDKSTNQKIGQVIHSRGKFFDSTFTAIASIDEGIERKLYFSDGKKSESLLIKDIEEDQIRFKRSKCSICLTAVGVLCSYASTDISTCFFRSCRVFVSNLQALAICQALFPLIGYTICRYFPNKLCRPFCKK